MFKTLTAVLTLLFTASLLADQPLSLDDCESAYSFTGMVGVRAGSELGSSLFRVYETFFVLETGLRGNVNESLEWQLDVESTLGALQRRNDYGTLLHIGPILDFKSPEGRWGIRIGFAPTLISNSHYGPVDLGGKFHFSSSLSAYWLANQKYALLYRFQHTSNGGLRTCNPGLDLHSLGIAYRF
jgi:hypothetical protein